MTEMPAASGDRMIARHLAELRARIDRTQSGDEVAHEELVADLETAYEELRVADEEVQSQQEQIAQLLEGRTMARWQQERMLSVLPVPMLRTDARGIIRTVNAATAGLTEMRVARLLGKPILALVPVDERPHLRRLIAQQARDGEPFRRRTNLICRDGTVVDVEVTATTASGIDDDVTWMVLDADHPWGDSTSPGVLPAVLSRLAGLPAVATDVQDLLGRAAALCHEALGADCELSLSTGSPAAPDAIASTSSIAQRLDGAQIVHSEGPCVTAFETMATVVSDDVRRDVRWRQLSPDVPAEVGGAVAVPLELGERLVGALNVYRLGVGTDARVTSTAELLAATVAAVLYEHGLKSELRDVAQDMERALTSRAVIDQAKGMVMADRHCTADEAFQHLVHLSSTQQVKLRDLARMLVERRGGLG